MEYAIEVIILIFILIWAYRLEINTTKTVNALNRIEKMLNDKKKDGK